MPHILVICTANICRSPYVEAAIEHELQQGGRGDWVVTSAGTWAQFERPAARYSIRLAKERGLDISGHIARMVTEEIMAEADLVICMTANHKEALCIDFRDHAHKVFLLAEMVGKSFDVSDPYGGPLEGYLEMTKMVDKLIVDGMPRITQLAARQAGMALDTSATIL